MKLSLDYKVQPLMEGVSIEMKSMENQDYQQVLKLMGILMPGDNDSENREERVKRLSQTILAEVMSKVIPKYCRNLVGLEIEENGKDRPATIEEFSTLGGFFMLAVQTLTLLFNASQLNTAQVDAVKKT